MSLIQLQRVILAKPERVFRLITDISSFGEVIQEIESIQMLTPDPFTVGSRWLETRLMMGRKVTVEMEMTELTPNQSVTFLCRSSGVRYESKFEFPPVETGTRLTLTVKGKATNPFGLLVDIVSTPIMKKALENDLTQIKAAAES